MPKQPETIDRVRIFADISIEMMGPVIVALTKMGIRDIGHELITDIITFKGSRKKVAQGETEQRVLAFIETNPTFGVAKDLVPALPGANHNTLHTVCQRLAEKGILVRLGEGNYRRSDVKQIAASSPSSAQPSDRAIDLVRTFMTGKKKFTIDQLKKVFEENGKRPMSVHQSCYELVQLKELKRTGTGEYAVIMSVAQRQKRDKALSKKRAALARALGQRPKKQRLNGAANGAAHA